MALCCPSMCAPRVRRRLGTHIPTRCAIMQCCSPSTCARHIQAPSTCRLLQCCSSALPPRCTTVPFGHPCTMHRVPRVSVNTWHWFSRRAAPLLCNAVDHAPYTSHLRLQHCPNDAPQRQPATHAPCTMRTVHHITIYYQPIGITAWEVGS